MVFAFSTSHFTAWPWLCGFGIAVLSAGVTRAQDFRTYPKSERPRGALHNALAPARDALSADLERFHARPDALLERVEQAQAELRGFASTDPDAELRMFQAELGRLRGSLRLALGASRLDRALEQAGRADLERARAIFEELLSDTSWRFEAELGIGRCEEILGRRIEALRRYTAASELDAAHEGPWLEKARLYREAGEFAQAAAEIAAALQRLPGEIHLELEALGCAIHEGGDHVERCGPFVRAIRDSPEPALRSRLAMLLVQQALLLVRRDQVASLDQARAAALLVQATQLDPRNGDAWYFHAEALVRQGFPSFVDAVFAFERAIEANTRMIEEAPFEQAKLVAVSYGRLIERDRERALQWMRRAQEYRDALREREIGLSGLDARLVVCFEQDVERGRNAFEAEQWSEALGAFQLATIADPTNAWVASYRGMCHGELGQNEEMRRAFVDAIDIAVAKRQDVWFPFVELAEEARAAGRIEEAQALAKRYLDAFPDGAHAAWFRERYS